MTSSIHLEFDLVNKRYRVVDTTNYLLSYGIPLLDMSSFNMKAYGTIVFNNDIEQQHITVLDPLIDLSVGETVSGWFDLPLDSNGEVVNGTWSCNDYSVRASADMEFLSITLPNTILTDGFSWLSNFLVTGNVLTLTAGTPQNVSILSVSESGPNCSITTSTAITSSTHNSILFDITNETGSFIHAYTGCVKVEGSISVVYDCDSGDNGTLTYSNTTENASVGHTIVSQAATITPPVLATLIAPVTTSLPSYTFVQLATNTWTVSLIQVLTYTQLDGLVVSYGANVSGEYKVTCSGSLCELNSCIESLRISHVAELSNGVVSKYQKNVDNILLYYMKAKGYKECGDSDNYTKQIALIKQELDDASCECSCCDDDEFKYIFNTSSSTLNIINQLLNDVQYKLFNGIPTATQDESAGFKIGSVLQNINTKIEYICTDITVGAAVWKVYYDPSALQYRLIIGVPTVNEDSSKGYLVGSILKNKNTNIEYVCTDITVGAAVWEVYYDPSSSNYKSYVALVTQQNTDAPVVSFAFNNTGLTFTHVRQSGGIYEMNITGGTLDPVKTFLIISNNFGSGQVTLGYVNTAQIVMSTRTSGGALSDNIITGGASIEIRIYN